MGLVSAFPMAVIPHLSCQVCSLCELALYHLAGTLLLQGAFSTTMCNWIRIVELSHGGVCRAAKLVENIQMEDVTRSRGWEDQALLFLAAISFSLTHTSCPQVSNRCCNIFQSAPF